MKNYIKLAIIIGILISGPISGILIKGYPISQYLEFPPKTLYVRHAEFSWPVFMGYLIFLSLVICGIIFIYKSKAISTHIKGRSTFPFPWWGWAGIMSGILFWVLAWSRFDWFSLFQRHTFTPLWLSYIVTVNAITCSRKGTCLIMKESRIFLWLFPISAFFWWSFEYLNRFVQNWYYLSADIGAIEYFIYATLSFSTVLPAVFSTAELLGTTSIIKRLPVKYRSGQNYPKSFFLLILVLSVLGLIGIGILPDILFPILWISPLLIITSIQGIFSERHVLISFIEGRWGYIFSFAFSALMCGFFWEMWNYLSYAKWKYSIPYVHAFEIFEMPILGYAGYLPFGLECVSVIELFFGMEMVQEIITCNNQ